ncbi:MAG: serine--tRNA ligase [Deltaproteobacteria bacterium]|jgi:seryl-tRNA synthetase|nr:serine--tRNA ligase [Deltaproteobacteria bacterium]
MHDLKFVRDNLPLIAETLEKRGLDPSLMDGFSKLDSERRGLLRRLESLQAERNRANDEITALRKKGGSPEALISSLKGLSAEIKGMEPELSRLEEEERRILELIPNVVHPSVPEGGEDRNREIRREGEIVDLGFPPRNHWEIGEILGLMDFPRAAKISGARFVNLAGELSRLNRALISFMLDLHTREHGYTECWPPAIVNSRSLFGTGQLPKFKEDLFKLENHDFYLIPTAEVPLTNLFRDETLDYESLPLSYTAYTPCFRAEAGAAGRDTRGLIRMHQFDKVELVKFSRPEDSFLDLETLTADAEKVLKLLKLPYRTVVLASGDLGFSSAKTYDLEVWLPGAGVFREISSCSCFLDFQARRAGIRYKKKGEKGGFLHTLNGSGLAVGRTLAAVLENYQREDGSVAVPEVLIPYVGTNLIRPAAAGPGKAEKSGKADEAEKPEKPGKPGK